jgi:benzoyl-CoA reductase/2-hydroxyglutaryl-CoA dehydratase subunit BcrC/BadD/HgdB
MDKTIIYPEYQELVSKATNWEYGRIYSHEEIAEIMMLIPRSPKYYAQVNIANKKLTELGKRLKSVNGQGYKVITPDEYVDEAIAKLDRGRRQARKAYEILQHAPSTLMSDEYRSKYNELLNDIVKVHSILEGGVTQIKIFARPQVHARSGRG